VDSVADILFNFLRDVIYSPASAKLNLDLLPEEFRDLGEGMRYFASCVTECRQLAQALSRGELDGTLPSAGNELASPLKSLHSSLKHLSWQTQQVAKGDYRQRVEFMGTFADAFNSMVIELEERRRIISDEKSRLERYVTLLLSNCEDIVLLFDAEGLLVQASESYLRCSKMEKVESLLGKTFRELFAPVVAEAFLQDMDTLFHSALAGKLLGTVKQEIALARDGNPRFYHIRLTPMLEENGDIAGAMAFLYDTTENQRAQRESERARELAEQSTRAKTDFLARMSHEMRTPMNAIIGMTTIAKSSDDPKRKEYCLNRIEEASQHLLGVINDILDMSKIEAGKLELSYAECDFADMVRRVSDIVSFRVSERRQTFSVDIDGNIPLILADEQRLAQIVANLLSNAVKFTPEEGSIALRARKTREEDNFCTIRCEVTDTGIGISEEQQKKLFSPFEQADGGISRKFGGTGLGLVISKRLVEMMSGRIWIKSQLGAGASFFFEIRAGIAEEKAPAPGTEESPQQKRRRLATADAPAEAPSDDNIFAGKRMLIAEDVDINREIMEALLVDTGVAISFAENGAEAVEKFSAPGEKWDVILMDIHMPGVDGYEATRRIRQSGLPGADTIPIIAMTANVFREDIDRCLACGMNDHIGKPVDIDIVIRTLREYLL
jgi:PAS domain S-box-containing protein